MHILIPYAAPAGPQCQAALARLQLPGLAALLQLLSPAEQLPGGPEQLSPLHERVQARLRGWADVDGLLPWAAAQAQALWGADAANADWAWVTPCHWTVHSDHVAMADPAQLTLAEAESQAFLQAMEPYFLEDGIRLHWHASGHWLAQGTVFHALPTASLERVRGAAVDAWMPRQAQARTLRRLQNEMQMLLYTHPLNDARAHDKLPTVNAFWVSATGALPATAQVQPNKPVEAPLCTVWNGLQGAALRDDAYTWVEAWHAMDRDRLPALVARARSGAPVTLTLCGEHLAQTYTLQRLSLWQRLQRRWSAPQPHPVLSTL